MTMSTEATVCPQWPDRCCLCLTKQCGVVLTGLTSIVFDVAFIISCAYTLFEPSIWNTGYTNLQNWVLSTQWDSEVSQVVLSYMVKINQYKQLILYVLITNSVIHALCGLNLIIGGLLSPTYKQRLLFLPWLTLDMIYIVLTTIVFVSWAFLSFFVHILVAIFFPVVSGAFLGLWIYAWRNVREHFIHCGQRGDELELLKHRNNKSNTLYRKLPPSSQSPTEMRIVPHYQHQVPV